MFSLQPIQDMLASKQPGRLKLEMAASLSTVAYRVPLDLYHKLATCPQESKKRHPE
jgi:hypothetical protein